MCETHDFVPRRLNDNARYKGHNKRNKTRLLVI